MPENAGVLNSSQSDRPLTLLEKKQQKWSKEKEDKTDWFPFGKPGSGAPLQATKFHKTGSDLSQPAVSASSTIDPRNPASQSGNVNGEPFYTSSNAVFIGQPGTSSNTSATTNGSHFLPQINSYPSPFGSIYSPPYITFVNYPSGNQGSPPAPVYQNLPYLPLPVNFSNNLHPNGVRYSTPNQSYYGERWSNHFGQWPFPQSHQVDSRQFVQPPQLSSPSHFNEFIKNIQPNFSGSPIYANQSNSSTGEVHPTTWISPQQHVNNGIDVFPGSHQLTKLNDSQNTAIVSPFKNDGNLVNRSDQSELNSFNKSSEYEIHRRRNAITEPKDGLVLEEKLQRINETKAAFDEQIAEKRRQDLRKLEQERLDAKRLESERKLLELKKIEENEQELNKWRRLLKEEERREHYVKQSWEKAKEEALKSKRSRLLQHARKKEDNFDHPDEDSFLISSPSTDANRSNWVNDEHSTPIAVALLSAVSLDKEDASRFQENPKQLIVEGDLSVISLSNNRVLPKISPGFDSPGDDRPIRPLTQDPLKLWDSAVNAKHPRIRLKDSSIVKPLHVSEADKLYENDSQRTNHVLGAERDVYRTNAEIFIADNYNDSKIFLDKDNVANRIAKDSKKIHKISSKNIRDDDLRQVASTFTAIKLEHNFSKPPSTTVKPKKSSSKASTCVERMNESVSSERRMLHSPNVTKRKKDKILSRPVTLNSLTLATHEDEENPWAGTLGTENPLLQPLKTRQKKYDVGSYNNSIVAGNATKLNCDRLTSTQIFDDKNDYLDEFRKKSSEKGPHLNLKLGSLKSVPLENDSEQMRFNFRNHQYSSSMSVKRQSSNGKSSKEIFDQLTKLREQLKQSQKSVADSLMVPRLSSKPTA